MSSSKVKKYPRILHATLALSMPPVGIVRQIISEQNASAALGIDWESKIFGPAELGLPKEIFQPVSVPLIRGASSLFTRIVLSTYGAIKIYSLLASHAKRYDFVILRYSISSVSQYLFLSYSKKNVLLVHHTKEEAEFNLLRGRFFLLRRYIESFLGPKSLKKAAGLIAVTQEILEYEIYRASLVNKPCFVYPNGCALEGSIPPDRRSHHLPEILFVASSFAPWHGLDLLLQSVSASDVSFVLHLVGRLPVQYLSLVKDRRIVLHGELTEEQVCQLSERCWIAVSSLAFYRLGMIEGCPLKTREYLKLGLPVYADYHDVFPADAFFFKRGSPDIGTLIHFAFDTRSISKSRVVQMASGFIAKEKLLFKLYRDIENSDQNNFFN